VKSWEKAFYFFAFSGLSRGL